MKVLHVIPSVSPSRGGPSRAITLMEAALTALGVEVETATTDDDGAGKRLPAEGREPTSHGARRWYFRKNTEFYQASWAFVPWILGNVHRFDVVHIHALFSFTSVVAAWAARRAGVPYVIRPLGLLSRYGVTQRRPLVKKISLRWVEGPLLVSAAAVHFTSPVEQSEAEELGFMLRPVVLPLGIDTSPAGDEQRAVGRWPALQGKQCVLYLSRIDPKKNLEGLIAAMAQVRTRFPSAVLLVCGEGDAAYVQQLTALAQRLGVGDSVLWAGAVWGDAKADALRLADLFVLPSFSENFGIAVVEALSAGLPCVVGHGVAIAADVEAAEAGKAVHPDASSVAQGLAFYLESADRRAQTGHAAQTLAETSFSVRAMGQRLETLYATVRAAKAAPCPAIARPYQ